MLDAIFTCIENLGFDTFENVPFFSHLTVNFDASFSKKYSIPFHFHQEVVEKALEQKKAMSVTNSKMS